MQQTMVAGVCSHYSNAMQTETLSVSWFLVLPQDFGAAYFDKCTARLGSWQSRSRRKGCSAAYKFFES